MDAKKRFHLLLVAVLVLFAAPRVGPISGTVTDTGGNPVSGARVTFIDESHPAHTMSAVTDANGKYQTEITTSVNENTDTAVTPLPFTLGQNFPNPFNPSTIVPFSLVQAGMVKLTIYTIQGQKIRTLADGHFSAGRHSATWDGIDDQGKSVSAGVYLYQLRAGNRTETKKMLLLDGGSGSRVSGYSMNSVVHSVLKIAAQTTYTVIITLSGSKPYEKTGVTITDGQTIDFMVSFEPFTTNVTFASIPGGTFQMGDVENEGYSYQKPVHSVTVSDFEMGVYEITNAQYAQFLNDAKASGDITATSSSVKGAKGAYSGQEYINLSGTLSGYYPDARCWITYNNGAFTAAAGKENWPVGWVTWYGSKAFALYDGLDLPTEAEWEYACRGGKQYKYGTDDGTLSQSKANYWNTGPWRPVAVGSYPKNPYGLCDMSGNVWEWCHDRYDNYTASSQNNPSGAQTGSGRVCRGGGWGSYGDLCRSAERHSYSPDLAYSYMGFRVVRRASPQNY